MLPQRISRAAPRYEVSCPRQAEEEHRGLGTVFGPAMGALIVTSMQQYLAQAGTWVTVTQSLIFMVCVLAFRRGVIGEIANRRKLTL
jgi:hypothetical protein